MKKLLSLIIGIFVSSASNATEPHTSIESAIEEIRSFQGAPENFKLLISDELNDPVGVNMAIITDSILEKGFEPNGFEQKEGYKVYVYKPL